MFYQKKTNKKKLQFTISVVFVEKLIYRVKGVQMLNRLNSLMKKAGSDSV